MTDEQQATEEDPFGDSPGEDASPDECFGYIGKTAEGDFTKGRRMVDYYMRRLQALQAEMAALTESVDEQIATHEAELEKLHDLRKTLVSDHASEATRIRFMLEGAWADFHEPIKAILGRGKTWKLTNGSISARTQQPVLEYDEPAAIAFVEEMPDLEAQGRLLSHTTKLKRSEMKKLVTIHPSGAVEFTDTGEILSFAVADVRDEKITITPRPPAAQEE